MFEKTTRPKALHSLGIESMLNEETNNGWVFCGGNRNGTMILFNAQLEYESSSPCQLHKPINSMSVCNVNLYFICKCIVKNMVCVYVFLLIVYFAFTWLTRLWLAWLSSFIRLTWLAYS